MNIYLVRHSKTKWNEQKRLQGHKDSPLTQEGMDNAYALKKYIDENNIQFDDIYSSPLNRAYTTAKVVAGKQDIKIDNRLKEMNFGDYEGQYISQLLAMNPSYYDMMWNNPSEFTCLPNGESYEDVLKRIDDFFNEITNSNAHNILIVTHGMYMILILAYILKLEKKDFTRINRNVAEGCSLNLISYEHNEYKIIYTDKKDFLPHISKIHFNK